MISRIFLSLILGASILSAQAIPERPEKLSYPNLSFQVPKLKEAKVKLKNGIHAYLVPDPTGQPLIHLRVLVKGGSYLEPKGKEGLAGITGSLLRTGGSNRTTAALMDEKLDVLAAQLQTQMDEDSLNINLNLLDKDVKEGLGLLMELLTQPAFQQDRLELAKKNLRQTLERRNDDTTSIERYQQGLLLRGEKHYTNAFPTAASLEAITREDCLSLHEKLLHPQNFILAVSGRFDRKAMTQLLNETLGALKPSPKAQMTPKVPAPEHSIQPGLYLCEKDVNQGRVTINLPGLRMMDPDWPAVQVLNHILGAGGFTSRMVKKIRSDEGLSYTVRSTFTPGAFYPGTYTALFQTKVRSVAFGTRLALAEMERIRKEPVSAEELKVAKGSIIEGFPERFGSKLAVANTFQMMDFMGLPETYWETYRDRIQAVTPEAILKVAQKYLHPHQAAILVVGGKAEELEAGETEHPGKLSEVAKLPVVKLPLRDPLTMKPIK